jgi:opacity protein-like surface antigen
MRQALIISVIIICLAATGPRQTAWALTEFQINMVELSVASVALSTTLYYVWKNSPAERARGYPENLGPGEWYVAGYSGLSLLPSTDWTLSRKYLPPFNGRTLSVSYSEAAILGGVKFGRYFDKLPWFGVEIETNFSRNQIPSQTSRISPPLPNGVSSLNLDNDRFFIWDLQTNFLARYGFFKDKEVYFGRLQPYVGLGPGFEIIYAKTDSAKNFAIEALAGLRYMCTPKISVFFEYKFSYQFAVEIEENPLTKDQSIGKGSVTFDVPHHRFLVGVSYHFKNLFSE